MISYAGIGSRQTPEDIQDIMYEWALTHADKHVLRSGHAEGADLAFEQGVLQHLQDHGTGIAEIYYPWPSFNEGRPIGYNIRIEPARVSPSADAMEMAARYHPSWKYLRYGAKKLMARNCHQVLGMNLDDPVEYVICWTPDGSLDGKGPKCGGTGQALRMAHDLGIKVYNLQREDHFDEIVGRLDDNVAYL